MTYGMTSFSSDMSFLLNPNLILTNNALRPKVRVATSPITKEKSILPVPGSI